MVAFGVLSAEEAYRAIDFNTITLLLGMAGLYGHEARNRATSKAIYGLSWAGRVADPQNAGRLLATGYSCRSQVSHVDNVALPHPIHVLLAAIKDERLAAARPDSSERADFIAAHHEED